MLDIWYLRSTLLVANGFLKVSVAISHIITSSSQKLMLQIDGPSSFLPFQVPFPHTYTLILLLSSVSRFQANQRVKDIRLKICAASNKPARFYSWLVKLADSPTVRNILPQVANKKLSFNQPRGN